MKPIKIDLILHGTRVTTLEELRDHFSIDILRVYEDGSLLTWLKTRGLMAEAQRLLEVATEDQSERMLALCEIFAVRYDVNAKNKDGYSLLYRAASEGHKDVVELLIATGADINAKASDGYTPLHRAASDGHEDVVKLLIAEGADINAKDQDGSSPLDIAASNGHKMVAYLLLIKGGGINAKDSDGYTPLHRAASDGHKNLVELLINKEPMDSDSRFVADINAKDNDGCTPLHSAASNGHKDVVEMLIVKGADINAKDKDGCTPRDRADFNGHKEVVALLVKRMREITCPHCGKESKFREFSIGECVTGVAKFAVGAVLWDPFRKAIKLAKPNGGFPNFVCTSCGRKVMQCGQCKAIIPYADFGLCPHCNYK